MSVISLLFLLSSCDKNNNKTIALIESNYTFSEYIPNSYEKIFKRDGNRYELRGYISDDGIYINESDQLYKYTKSFNGVDKIRTNAPILEYDLIIKLLDNKFFNLSNFNYIKNEFKYVAKKDAIDILSKIINKSIVSCDLEIDEEKNELILKFFAGNDYTEISREITIHIYDINKTFVFNN